MITLFISIRFWLNSFFFSLSCIFKIYVINVYYFKNQSIKFCNISSEILITFAVSQNIQYTSVFWMTEMTHRLFSLLLIFPKSQNQDTCIWVPQIWLHKTLGMISLYFQKTIIGDKEMVENIWGEKSKEKVTLLTWKLIFLILYF